MYLIKTTSIYKLLLLINVFFYVGCGNVTPQKETKLITTNDNALYKGKLVRLSLFLDTENKRKGNTGYYSKQLQSAYLDKHFTGSTEMIYTMDVHAENLDWHCSYTDTLVVKNRLSGSFVYKLKTIRPNKTTIFTSSPIPFYREREKPGKCKSKWTKPSRRVMTNEALDSVTKLFSLQMSMAQGSKDVSKEYAQALQQVSSITKSDYIGLQKLGNVYVSTIKGIGNGIGAIGNAVGSTVSVVTPEMVQSSLNQSVYETSPGMAAMRGSMNNYNNSDRHALPILLSSCGASDNNGKAKSKFERESIKNDRERKSKLESDFRKREKELNEREWKAKKIKRENASREKKRKREIERREREREYQEEQKKEEIARKVKEKQRKEEIARKEKAEQRKKAQEKKRQEIERKRKAREPIPCVSHGHVLQPGELVCYRSSMLQYRCATNQPEGKKGLLYKIQKISLKSDIRPGLCDHIDERNSRP